MVRWIFTLGDLAATRFAISPMWELVTSLRMLRDPDRAALHLPWVRRAMPIARGLALKTAFALTPSKGYMPDFLTPPPSTPIASFEDELELLRETPPEQVENDVALLFRRRKPPATAQALLADPKRGLAELAEALAEYWRLALEPDWPRIRALLEADLAHRARRLTEGGPAALFDDLHPTVRWAEGELFVDQEWEKTIELKGRGLLLVPTAFQWQGPASIIGPPWQETLLYPARGAALLWEPGDGTPEALANVVGSGRAGVLDALDAPRSTTELAARLSISAGGVSQHLTALRQAGLVSSAREGRLVLYVRTPAGEQLLAAGRTDR